MIETKKSTIAYWKIVSCLVVFSAMFIFNFIFPIEKSLLPFYSITNRAWHWCEILISELSVYYIFKIRTLNFMDLVVSCVLGDLQFVHTMGIYQEFRRLYVIILHVKFLDGILCKTNFLI